MDPRHPQHPYSRAQASPYSHAPFQQTQSQAPFPPASHPTSTSASYSEHQRRPSDSSPYYAVPSGYPRDAAPMPTSNHSRQHSSSSAGPASVARHMPPPSSPQQQPQHAHQQHSGSFPPPSMSRQAQPPLGPPLGFPSNRDLPSLSSINRPGSVNSTMSISSMLGGPSAAARDSAPPPSQYPAPPAMGVNGSASYAHSHHASPRVTASAGPDFDRFRRPQTPEHRPHQGVRDHRANSAGSPPRAVFNTPESQRYGTPQAGYQPRNAPGSHAHVLEERREQYASRVPNPNAMPPRPNSQPIAFPGPSQHLSNEPPRQELSYGRQMGYTEREREEMHYRERERQRLEEEHALHREAERRERMGYAGPHPSSQGHDPIYGRQYHQTQAGQYEAPRDSREPGNWARRPEQMGHEPSLPQHGQPTTSAYEYARPPQSAFPGRQGEHFAGAEARYPPTTFGQSTAQQAASAPMPQYGSPPQERRTTLPQSSVYQGQGANATHGSYYQQESPRRAHEEMQQPQQRGYLGFQQEGSRKGRNSPLPQAVQGAQGPSNGPGSEPGIKNEFGKMFSGIGSGVGGLGSQGNASAGAQTPYSNPGPLRRDDLENVVMQDVGESGGKVARSGSRSGSGSRRRKLKDEGADDDSSTGRRTPSGRKRVKPGTQAQGAARQGTGHRYDLDSGLVSPPAAVATLHKPVDQQAGQLPLEHKAAIPHHHHIRHHHHHHHHGVAPSKPHYTPIPKPKQIVRSQSVIDSVSHLPRVHLGHQTYHSEVIPANGSGNPGQPSRRGYRTKMEPLPRFDGKENCTFTIRVPRIYLSDESREELTANRNVWGTDVYTDDSDVIAACIHSGWIRGSWPDDVDVTLLGLDINDSRSKVADDLRVKGNGAEDASRPTSLNGEGLESRDLVLQDPPLLGPMWPLPDADLHVTILILQPLEKYASSVRFGIKSRPFDGNHDGLSYSIIGIKWVHGVDTAGEARGEPRRRRMQLRVNQATEEESELEDGRWKGLLDNGNGYAGEEAMTGAVIQESYLRASPGPLEGVSGLGKKGWYREGRPKHYSKIAAEPSMEDNAQSPQQVASGGLDGSAETQQQEKAEELVRDVVSIMQRTVAGLEEPQRQMTPQEIQREKEEIAANSLAGLSEAAETASLAARGLAGGLSSKGNVAGDAPGSTQPGLIPQGLEENRGSILEAATTETAEAGGDIEQESEAMIVS